MRLDTGDHLGQVRLAPHQRPEVLDRRDAFELGKAGSRNRAHGLAGRIRDQMKVKIAAVGGHADACISCESLWGFRPVAPKGSALPG